MGVFFNVKSHREEVERAKAMQIEAALFEMGLAALDFATNTVPVDTGRLRGSLSFDTKPNTMIIGTNVEYAIYVEKRGGKGGHGAYYLRNSISDHLDVYRNILKKALTG